MDNSYSEKEIKLTKSGIITILAPFRWMILSSIAFFVAAGTMRVPRFWIFLGVVFIGAIISAIMMGKYSPELANQRSQKKTDTKKWDYFLVIPYLLILILIVPLIAGFDIVRFKWSFLGNQYLIAGIGLYIIAFIIVQWSIRVNRHFEGTVRIQKDREHKVITSGPYKIVRHPGYSGMAMTSISLPLLLGSLYAFFPVVVSIILLVIRTYKEDITLQKELEGYLEYTKRTKYRLLPFIW